MSVSILAPWTSTSNLGDYLIGDACVQTLWNWGVALDYTFSTHQRPPLLRINRLRSTKHLILAGTNAISARMEINNTFWITPDLAALYRHKVILMGVGWGSEVYEASKYTRWLVQQILNPDAIHSTRDPLLASYLTDWGFQVAVTGCPTTWELKALPGVTPREFGLVTVSELGGNALEREASVLRQAGEVFDDWAVQPASFRDTNFAQRLGVPRGRILPPTVESFNRFLDTNPCAVVGSRLHAGIRALQRGRSAVIVIADNRARELSKVSRLPIVEWSPDADLGVWLDRDWSGPVIGAEQSAEIERYRHSLVQIVSTT